MPSTIYFSDFGLALSSQFELAAVEQAFFDQHKNYDVGCGAVNLFHSIITSQYGKEHWIDKLRLYLNGEGCAFGDYTERIIRKHASIAILMDDFLTVLQNGDKNTLFPASQLAEKLAALSD